MKKIERGTLWCNPKNSKKSPSAEKSGAKVGSLVCFRGSGRVLFSFRFGRASEVRVL